MLKCENISALMIIIEKLYFTAYPNDILYIHCGTVEYIECEDGIICILFVLAVLPKGKCIE